MVAPLRQQLLHLFDRALLELKRGVHIAVERDFGIGVPHELGHGFGVHARLNAARGKGVAQGVEGRILQGAVARVALKLLLHIARLGVLQFVG